MSGGKIGVFSDTEQSVIRGVFRVTDVVFSATMLGVGLGLLGVTEAKALHGRLRQKYAKKPEDKRKSRGRIWSGLED